MPQGAAALLQVLVSVRVPNFPAYVSHARKVHTQPGQERGWAGRLTSEPHHALCPVLKRPVPPLALTAACTPVEHLIIPGSVYMHTPSYICTALHYRIAAYIPGTWYWSLVPGTKYAAYRFRYSIAASQVQQYDTDRKQNHCCWNCIRDTVLEVRTCAHIPGMCEV